MLEYKFHQKCYTCSHVVESNSPILFGYIDKGDIILHCGEEHDWESEPPKVVGIGHLFEKDASIKHVFSLENGFGMERKTSKDSWEIIPIPPMEE